MRLRTIIAMLAAAAAALALASAATAAIKSSGMRDTRYCEIFTVFLAPSPIAKVNNSYGLNNCRQGWWESLDPAARPKVRRYYQQLEGGILDPTRVAASVWDAITSLLGRSRVLLSAPPGPSPASAPMYRGEAQFQLSEQVVLRSASEPDAPDEVDTLFLGTPGD